MSVKGEASDLSPMQTGASRNTRRRPVSLSRVAWQVLAPALGLVLVTCDSPFGPSAGPACELPVEAATAPSIETVDPGGLASALEYVAGPVAVSLASPVLAGSLTQTKGFVTEFRPASVPINGCRSVARSLDALMALPDSPETLAERHAIQHVLTLTAAAFDPSRRTH